MIKQADMGHNGSSFRYLQEANASLEHQLAEAEKAMTIPQQQEEESVQQKVTEPVLAAGKCSWFPVWVDSSTLLFQSHHHLQ